MVKKKSEYSELNIELFGCPITVAYGGLHGALKNVTYRSDSERIILNYDVALTIWGN